MKYHELFEVKGLPVFQNKMFPDRESARSCSRGEVRLVQDLETGLVLNAAFDPSLLEYDESYQNEQACSQAFRNHLEEVKGIIARHYRGKKLIEVGCGKGHFLEELQRSGYRISGVDPAYEGSNPSVHRACFDASLGISGDGVLLRHVLEHISDPVSFLAAIAEANGGRGTVYIEVPCFDWICRSRAWFDVFYEHVNYFRLQDFERIFGTVYESGHLFGGQYLFVVADLSSLRRPVLDKRLPGMQFPADFLAQIGWLAKRGSGKRNAVWGGSSKGVIFSLYLQRAGVEVGLVVDINPAKQGKYLPATGLRVFSPEEALKLLHPGDDLFVMNSNYLEEIVRLTENRFRYIAVDQAVAAPEETALPTGRDDAGGIRLEGN